MWLLFQNLVNNKDTNYQCLDDYFIYLDDTIIKMTSYYIILLSSKFEANQEYGSM